MPGPHKTQLYFLAISHTVMRAAAPKEPRESEGMAKTGIDGSAMRMRLAQASGVATATYPAPARAADLAAIIAAPGYCAEPATMSTEPREYLSILLGSGAK